MELDSTNFCTGHDVPPAKYSSHQLLKLKPRLFTQPVGWVETVRVRRPRASAFYQATFCQSVRPTHPRPSGPFAVRFSQTLEFDRRPFVMFEFGVRGDYFLLPWQGWWQGGGNVVAAPTALHQVRWTGGTYTNSKDNQRPNKCEGEVTMNNEWIDRIIFLIYPHS